MTTHRLAREDVFALYTDEDLAAAAAVFKQALAIQAAPVLQEQLEAVQDEIAQLGRERHLPNEGTSNPSETCPLSAVSPDRYRTSPGEGRHTLVEHHLGQGKDV